MSSSVRSQPCGHGLPPAVLSRISAGVVCRLRTSRCCCLEYVESFWNVIDPLPRTSRDDAGKAGISAFHAATRQFNIRATSGLRKRRKLEVGLFLCPFLRHEMCGIGRPGRSGLEPGHFRGWLPFPGRSDTRRSWSIRPLSRNVKPGFWPRDLALPNAEDSHTRIMTLNSMGPA